MWIGVVVAAVLAQQSGELFQDKGEFFVRAGSSRNLQMGAQLKILGDFIGNTGQRRTVGKVTILELWPELARVSLDAGARAAIPSVPDGQLVAVVELPEEIVVPPPSPERLGSFYVDPLGFLTFGPALGVELGAGRVTGAAYARWFSGGLASYLLLGTGDHFDFSFGIGARLRFYFRERFSGFHLGLAAEWLRTVVENPLVLMTLTSNFLVPQFEAGYRWAGERLFIDLAGSAGVSARLFWKTENLPGGNLAGSYVPSNLATFFWSAKLELGVFF